MNSLKTFQALNQVVNHDICPQMKRQNEQIKLLVDLLTKEKLKNDNLKKYNTALEKQNCSLDIWRENFQSEGYFLCSECEYIHNEDTFGEPAIIGGRLLCETCFEEMTDYD